MKVKQLLSTKSKWTKLACARDKKNMECPVNDPSAVKYCLEGAIIKCYQTGEERNRVENLIRRALRMSEVEFSMFKPIYDGRITYWNDAPKRTFKDIKKLISKLNI